MTTVIKTSGREPVNLRIVPADNKMENDTNALPCAGWKFYLNDMDIGNHMFELQINIGAHAVPTATIKFIVKPSIPDDLLAFLDIEIDDRLDIVKKFRGYNGSNHKR